jgi:hypothetical protein
MRLLLVFFCSPAFAIDVPDLSEDLSSGSWPRIAGSLALLLFAAGAWIVRTQRRDIEMMRAKIDAQIERNYRREARIIEQQAAFQEVLAELSKSIDDFSKILDNIEKQVERANGAR